LQEKVKYEPKNNHDINTLIKFLASKSYILFLLLPVGLLFKVGSFYFSHNEFLEADLLIYQDWDNFTYTLVHI